MDALDSILNGYYPAGYNVEVVNIQNNMMAVGVIAP
jgi:hypothetical protein